MQIPRLNAHLGKILAQVFCHLFGQCRDKDPLIPFNASVYFADQVVDLVLRGLNDDDRIKQSRGPDDLLNNAAALFKLKIGRRGRHENRLADHALKLLKIQWPVVKCRREPEPVINQALLSRHIAAVHAAHLGQRYMGLVYEHEKVALEIVQKTRRPLTLFPP